MSRSCISLFISNLRLLDLDRLPDWPNITAQTFSTSGQQDQKARIKCTEWALYRLFEIWDSVETRSRLQPFFPPFEPLQSINLRAALFRFLNELKKNGILGRESILRKTVLDECKGDKFLEVLFLFSTAVLKRGLEGKAQQQAHMTITQRISTATHVPSTEQNLLVPLIIAHASALSTMVASKSSDSSLYGEVHELLEMTQQDILEREGKFEQIISKTSSGGDQGPTLDALRKQLQENWVANGKWLDIAIHGDEKQADDDLLGGTFKEFLRTIQSGDQPTKLEAQVGLLDDLDSRVQSQQQRLRRWKQFHEGFRTTSEAVVKGGTSKSRRARQSLQLKFVDHEMIKPGTTISTKPARSYHDIKDYRNVVDATLEELKAVSKINNRSPRPRRSTITRETSTASAKVTLPKNEKRVKTEVSRAPKHYSDKAHEFLPPSGLDRSETKPSPRKESPSEQYTARAASTLVQPETPRLARPDSGFKSASTPVAPIYESAEDVPPTLADQIIASVADATPSPAKRAPRLSLSDRARLSMAAHMLPSHTASLDSVAESPRAASPDLPLPDIPEPSNRRTTLLERTRQSMSMMSRYPKPRVSMHKKRESRQSLFPVDQFETPKKTSGMLREYEEEPEEPKATVTSETVYAEDIDYDSIFKSRPKIALSPVASPSLADLDATTPTGQWESSPLGKFNSKRVDDDDNDDKF